MIRKLLFFDIDHTITSEVDESIPASAILAIREARSRGHLVFVNTGRCIQTVAPAILDIGFNGIVCGCGSSIYMDGRKVMSAPIDSAWNRILTEAALDCHIDLLFEGEEAMSFVFGAGETLRRTMHHYRNYQRLGMRMMDSLDPEFRFIKFCACFRNPEDMKRFRETSDRYFYCIDRDVAGGDYLCELVPLGYTKASGIRWVQDYFGVSREDTYAFGDSNNDLTMFEGVGHGIAMGNCDSPLLLARAEYVTGRASEDGLAAALRHYRIIDS